MNFKYVRIPAINGPSETWFITTPIVIFKNNKIRKILHMGGKYFPYPTVIRADMINIASIDRNSGNHVTYRLSKPKLDK